MKKYKNGGWIGQGNYLTIIMDHPDRQVVRIELEADGYAHPEMTPHPSDHRPIYMYRVIDSRGDREISYSTANRFVRAAKKEMHRRPCPSCHVDGCERPTVWVALYEDGGEESTSLGACDEYMHRTFPLSHPCAPHASRREEMPAQDYGAGKPWSIHDQRER